MHQKQLLKIASKPPEMSGVGVHSSDHDHSSRSSWSRENVTAQPSPKRPQAGAQAPIAGSYAPASLTPFPPSSITGYPPSYLSSTPLGFDAELGMYDQMSWNPGSGYDQGLVYGPSDMMPTSVGHQVAKDGYSSEGMIIWQTATDGYGSASTLPYDPYALSALEENSAHTQPYPAEPFYLQGTAGVQLQAGVWGTQANDDMLGAPLLFSQQLPTSVAAFDYSHGVGDNWTRFDGTMSIPGPSHNDMLASAPLRHSQVLQQTLANGAAGPSTSLPGACPRKRGRCDPAVASPVKNGKRVEMSAGGVGDDGDQDADEAQTRRFGHSNISATGMRECRAQVRAKGAK